jgi:cobalt-zinc-cadmium efflux system outer membrane protein
VAALWLWLAAPAALAQGEALTLEAFLDFVARGSPELAAAEQQQRIAAAEGRIASAYPNPEIELGGGPWRSRVGGTSGTASTFGILQPLELPSVREARIGAAAAELRAAAAKVSAARLAIGYQARQAYYDLLRRQEDERLAEENFRLLSDIQRRVLKRVEVGEAPRFELVRAESEALSAQNLLAAARLRVEEAKAVMRRLSGNRLPPAFEAAGALPAVPPQPPLDVLQAEVLAAHPALAVLRAEAERARRQLEQERALAAPQPGLRFQDARDPEMRNATIGLTLTVPLWNRREGQIGRARAAIDLALAQLEQQRVQLLRELDSAYARLAIAQRQISTFEAGLLRSAETALEVAEAAYRFGERSFLEVLDAQRTVRALRADYNQVRFERIAAWLDIERLRARDPFGTEKR